jgi:arsenical pump membrane protein
MTPSQWAIYAICVIAMFGVLIRPWRLPEAPWAVGGAMVLVVAGLVPWRDAVSAVGRGTDVYLFLLGMMLLSELARREGLFDWLAAVCVRRADGSAPRLLLLVYAVGVIVTIFMSNDATAVVLTPAVLAVARKARAKPLPYLMACALIANAASFVLPISNPANLVVFGKELPPLFDWFGRFAWPSLLSIVTTWCVLRLLHRNQLRESIERDIEVPALSRSGRMAAIGIALVAIALLLASAFDIALGLPTLTATGLVCAAVLIGKQEAPWALFRHVSWPVLLLVAGLFVMVDGLQHAGAIAALTTSMRQVAASMPALAPAITGIVVAYASNLLNNLPAGLIAASVVTAAHADTLMQSAIAIGIDLGPNLSVTGSLATILWLVAIRREGEDVSAWTFLKTGMVAMPVALAASLLGLTWAAS